MEPWVMRMYEVQTRGSAMTRPAHSGMSRGIVERTPRPIGVALLAPGLDDLLRERCFRLGAGWSRTG